MLWSIAVAVIINKIVSNLYDSGLKIQGNLRFHTLNNLKNHITCYFGFMQLILYTFYTFSSLTFQQNYVYFYEHDCSVFDNNSVSINYDNFADPCYSLLYSD
jgi:hypothetical protein